MAEGLAFLYPGQGSQSVGMGQALAQRFSSARDVFDQADEVLGVALSRLCFEGPAETLALTENTQPALLACSWALTRVLREELHLEPSWAAGHSLGEFSALVAAGALQFPDALRIVRERGRAMQEAVPVGEGTMAAILGLDPETVASLCREAAQGDVVAPANFNGPAQVVIAGHRAAVERAGQLAKDRGAKRVAPLPVSAPFHCALMKPAARRLAALLDSTPIARPQIPVISNVDAAMHGDAASVRDALVRQVTAPVRWHESMVVLSQLGCRQALEVGPGKILCGLVKRIAAEIQCLPAEDVDRVRQGLAA